MNIFKIINQKSIILLIAVIGVIIFIAITNFGEFKNKLFATIFPKNTPFAAGTVPLNSLVEFKDSNGNILNCDYTKSPIECTTSTTEVQVTIKDLSPLEQ